MRKVPTTAYVRTYLAYTLPSYIITKIGIVGRPSVSVVSPLTAGERKHAMHWAPRWQLAEVHTRSQI